MTLFMIIAFPRHRRRRRGTSSALPLIYIFRIYIYTASTSSYTAQLVASSREVNSPLSIACQYGYISRSSRLVVVVVAIYTTVCWRQKEGERERGHQRHFVSPRAHSTTFMVPSFSILSLWGHFQRTTMPARTNRTGLQSS